MRPGTGRAGPWRALLPRLLFWLGSGLPLAPAAQAAGAEQGIKIATWNVEWLTQRKAGDPALPDDAKPKRDEDIAVLAGYASQLDAAAVALEEVDDPALVAATAC